eukprot:scaffold1352_cov261-Pinguiococcus_pyrenoidosus.AAC.3
MKKENEQRRPPLRVPSAAKGHCIPVAHAGHLRKIAQAGDQHGAFAAEARHLHHLDRVVHDGINSGKLGTKRSSERCCLVSEGPGKNRSIPNLVHCH